MSDYGGLISRIAPACSPPDDSLIAVRLLINSFPKSGTHLAQVLARMAFEPFMCQNWVGTFDQNSWSADWISVGVERTFDLCKWMTNGTFTKGHNGYDPKLEELLDMHVLMMFVYRDLRDVAVSQMYHCVSDDDMRYQHPGKQFYRSLPDDESRLIAIIEGTDEWPGLFTRWELYAPWLDVDGVLGMPYEFMVCQPYEAASTFYRYVMGEYMARQGMSAMLCDEYLDTQAQLAVKAMGKPENSPTFRKGKTGGWKNHFTPRVKDVFKEHAGDWLIQLGHEENHDW